MTATDHDPIGISTDRLELTADGSDSAHDAACSDIEPQASTISLAASSAAASSRRARGPASPRGRPPAARVGGGSPAP